MGFENRDYYREDETPGGFGGAAVWKWIVGITIGVFLLEIATMGRGGASSLVERWLWLDGGNLLRGQLWRLVTYAVCHDTRDILHLVFNMLFLYWFGSVLEGMLGPREFGLFYLGGVLAAAACFLLIDAFMPRAGHVIGASGGVMAVTGLYAWHYPRQKILLFFLIPVEIWLLVSIFVAFDLFPLLMELQGGGETGVAHAAHLGGLAFGLAYGKFGWRAERLIPAGRPKLRVPRRKPDLKVFDPRAEKAELDRQVDAILTKISEQGEASLTSRERKTLQDASRKYRKPL